MFVTLHDPVQGDKLALVPNTEHIDYIIESTGVNGGRLIIFEQGNSLIVSETVEELNQKIKDEGKSV
jgi:uncharacterized protein YlzI (FlbEa/FlbD family)